MQHDRVREVIALGTVQLADQIREIDQRAEQLQCELQRMRRLRGQLVSLGELDDDSLAVVIRALRLQGLDGAQELSNVR